MEIKIRCEQCGSVQRFNDLDAFKCLCGSEHFHELPDEASRAFDRAIRQGRLSDLPTARNYAGAYMFMGNHNGEDQFKHINTRQYLPATITEAEAVKLSGRY